MTGKRVRAVAVDDATLVREHLQDALTSIDWAPPHANIETLLATAPEVDVVVLDLFLSAGPISEVRQGRVAIRALAEAGYRICLYTEERRPLVLARCLAAGASGVVHKSDSMAALAHAVVAVAAGDTAITPSLVGVAEVIDRSGGLPELTSKQRDVLHKRARGESFKEIARCLHITEGVAHGHMRAVTHKFAAFLQGASPGDLEHALGIAPHDLLDEE